MRKIKQISMLVVIVVILSLTSCNNINDMSNNISGIDESSSLVTYGIRGDYIDIIDSNGNVIDSIDINKNDQVRRLLSASDMGNLRYEQNLYIKSLARNERNLYNPERDYLGEYLFEKCSTGRKKTKKTNEYDLKYFIPLSGEDWRFSFDEERIDFWDLKVFDEYGSVKFDLGDEKYLDIIDINYNNDGFFRAYNEDNEVMYLDLNGEYVTKNIWKKMRQKVNKGNEDGLVKLSDNVYVLYGWKIVDKDKNRLYDKKLKLMFYSEHGYVLYNRAEEQVRIYDQQGMLKEIITNIKNVTTDYFSNRAFILHYKDDVRIVRDEKMTPLFELEKKENVYGYKNGMFIYNNGKGEKGLVDKEKKLVVDCKYKKIQPMVGEKYLVQIIKNEYKVLDGNYKVCAEFSLGKNISGCFNNGFCVVYQNGKGGIINEKGEWVIQPIYDTIFNFEKNRLAKDYIPIKQKKKSEESYDNIIVKQYINAESSKVEDDTRALVSQGNKYMLINGLGEVVKSIPKKYNKALKKALIWNQIQVKSGAIVFRDKKKVFLLDKTGEIRCLRFKYVSDFENDVALANDNGKAVLINKQGKIIKKSNLSWRKWFGKYRTSISKGLIRGKECVTDMDFNIILRRNRWRKNDPGYYGNRWKDFYVDVYDGYIYNEPGANDAYNNKEIYDANGNLIRYVETIMDPHINSAMGYYVEGKAIRPKLDRAFVYKDENFNNLFGRAFVAASPFYKGHAFVTEADRTCWLINSEGNHIMRLPDKIYTTHQNYCCDNNGMIIIQYMGRNYWLNLENGLMFPSKIKFDEWGKSNYHFIKDKSKERFFIINKKGEITSDERYDFVSNWG